MQLLALTAHSIQAGAGSSSHDAGQGSSTSSLVPELVQNTTTSMTMLDSMPCEEPCPSHQHTMIFDVDLRICTLTMILSILDPQASSPTKGPLSIEFKVAMHIAMLLTRGVDKRRGRGVMGLNIQPIAVAM